MRSGSFPVPQTLSPEASSVLQHSLLLANRRGHPQLTPLHVAATLLTTSPRFSSALKSSPLQCRALELCLNVSLNRLPSTPLLPPSLSNSLVAALKRAQAHQRRSGWPDPQPAQNCFLMSIRVDLDRLIISILDDPSVSRVMREAGFSSTSVKSNLEEYFRKTSFVNYNNEPISSVFDIMLGRKKRKNIVLVGETSNEAEGLASRAMDALERGCTVEGLDSVKLVKVQFSAVPLRLMRREEIEMNVADLRRKVESFGLGGRVVVYVGDLKWAVERDDDDDDDDERTAGFYSPVDHLIAEIGEMVSWYSNGSSRVWLMATASYETLMKCERKEPPCVDVLWDLEAVRVPFTSGMDTRVLSKDGIALSCCPECVSNFEKEYYAVAAASAQLPYWLKPHASNNKLDLTRKYNSLCQNMHNNRHQVKTTLSLGDSDTKRGSVVSVVRMKLLVNEFNRKRKPDRDFAGRVKSRRNSKCGEKDAFDLNVKAEDEDHHDERGQFSPISSDLTREITTEQQSSMMFLERIKNQLVFNMDLGKEEIRAREMLLSKLKSSFHRAGDYVASFEVDENVLEEVFRGSGFYRNNLFDKWVRDVFRSSLGMIGGAGEDKVSNVRLCLDGESGESCGNDGFMGTCLPKMIPLCFV